MSVLIGVGDIVIPYLNYQFHSWNTTSYTLTIAASDPTYARTSVIVVYEDRTSAINNQANNPGMAIIKEVAGTPSNSPVTPTSTTIQAAVGSGNPYVILSNINVRAATTSILTADITDLRPLYQLGSGVGGILMTQIGTLSVANDVSPIIVVPKSGFFTKLYAKLKTAPVGQDVTGRINKNGVQVATFDIPAGSATLTVTGLSLPFSAGDYFTLDIIQVGTSTIGSDLTIALG